MAISKNNPSDYQEDMAAISCSCLPRFFRRTCTNNPYIEKGQPAHDQLEKYISTKTETPVE